jgi:hypothetical protein
LGALLGRCKGDDASLDGDGRRAAFVAGTPRLHLHLRRAKLGPLGRSGEETSAAGQHAILGRAHNQLHRLRPTREYGIDVAFAILHDDDLGGDRCQMLGCHLGPRLPTPALLLVEGNGVVHGGGLLVARPDLRARHAEQGLVLGVHHDHGMHEEAVDAGIAGRAEPVHRTPKAIEVDLGRVLHRHDAEALASLRRARDVGREHLGRLHVLTR